MSDDNQHKGNSSVGESCRTAIRYDLFSNGLMAIVFIIGAMQEAGAIPLAAALLGLLSIVTYALNVAEYMYQYAMSANDKKLDRLKLIASILNHIAYGFFVAYVIARVATSIGYL